MHVSDGYWAVKIFTCTSVTQSYFTVTGNRNTFPEFSVITVIRQILQNFRIQNFFIFFLELIPFHIYIVIGKFQGILNIIFICTVKYRCCNIESQCFCSKTQVDFQHLSDIHTRRHTQRVQYDIQRTAVWQEWHIFYRKHTGNNTLVTVTSGHLITNGNLSLLCNINANRLIYSRRQFISILSCKYLRIHNNTIFAMWYFQRGITYFTGFFTKNCTKQSFFCCQLCFSLRSNFTYQNVSCTNLGTNTDDTTFIQILQCIITHTWNISCNFFRSQFRISGFCFIFFNMNRSIYIILNQSLT